MALFGMTNPHTLGGGVMGSSVGANDRDFRPRNIHEMAFKLWPTSPTPFTYMTSKLPSRTTDDPEYKIFEWRLPVMTWTVDSVDAGSDPIFEITIDATGIAAFEIASSMFTPSRAAITALTCDSSAVSPVASIIFFNASSFISLPAE